MRGGDNIFLNKYEIKDNYVIIHIYETKKDIDNLCYVDLDGLECLKKYNMTWFIKYNRDKKLKYAQANKRVHDEKGRLKYSTILMHRLLMNITDSKIKVDHEDHDTLNNRKYNLRVSVNDENTKHRKGKNSNNKSGYRNVCWNKDCNKWSVQIIVNGKNHIIKMFDDVNEAGKFAELKRKELYGDFAGNS
jgi:hypothetical protein